MSDRNAPPLNAGAIVKAFLDHQVQFVVVGGVASAGHGATQVTYDLDVCPAWNDANLARVCAALRSLGAQLKTDNSRGMGTQPSVRMLRQMEITTWRTPVGDVDVLLGIPRDGNWQLAQFRQLDERAAVLRIGEASVAIAALSDIIRSKEIADRPSDRAALPELRALLDRGQPTEVDARAERPHGTPARPAAPHTREANTGIDR